MQATLRLVFRRWGLPQRLRVDNGWPWGSWNDLPPALALWLLGLGVAVTWNRPRRAQENGVVERAHGVLQQWVEPPRCADVTALQARLEWAAALQREQYPAVRGRSRVAAAPGVLAGGRPYSPADEAAAWELGPVCRFLAQGLWPRRVDKVGRVSLYNRAYTVGRRYAGQVVTVRFDEAARAWLMLDDQGREIIRHAAPEISRERIVALDVAHRRPSARAQPGAEPHVRGNGAEPYVG